MASPAILIAHRRSPSPLVLAVDAAADGQGLPCIPESPLDNRPSFDSRPSFDTLVRDLIQSRPDSPIGGHELNPNLWHKLNDSAQSDPTSKPKRSFNVGTLLTKGKSTPRIEISCADIEPCGPEDMNKPPKTRKSESGSENLHPSRSETQTCSTTPPMFTAPESLRVHSRTDGSDNDMDDLELPITEVRDFGLASDGTRSKKASKVPEPAKVHKSVRSHESVNDSAPSHELEQASTQHPVPESDLDYCEDCVSPMTKAPPKKEFPKTLRKSDEHTDGKAAMGGKNDKDAKTGKLAVVPKSLKGSERSGNGKSGKNGTTLPTGVLNDATGQLSPFGTPKPKKRVVLKSKGQMAIRKASLRAGHSFQRLGSQSFIHFQRLGYGSVVHDSPS